MDDSLNCKDVIAYINNIHKLEEYMRNQEIVLQAARSINNRYMNQPEDIASLYKKTIQSDTQEDPLILAWLPKWQQKTIKTAYNQRKLTNLADKIQENIYCIEEQLYKQEKTLNKQLDNHNETYTQSINKDQ